MTCDIGKLEGVVICPFAVVIYVCGGALETPINAIYDVKCP
jgi:hypothetical protein